MCIVFHPIWVLTFLCMKAESLIFDLKKKQGNLKKNHSWFCRVAKRDTPLMVVSYVRLLEI